MKNQIYNFILKYTPNSILFKWSLFLNKHARILLESFAYSPALFDINGESWFLKNHPFTLKNVIDGGANKGDWTEHLIKYNKDLE